LRIQFNGEFITGDLSFWIFVEMLPYPCELFNLRALIMLSISLVVIGLLCVYNVMTRISEGGQDYLR